MLIYTYTVEILASTPTTADVDKATLEFNSPIVIFDAVGENVIGMVIGRRGVMMFVPIARTFDKRWTYRTVFVGPNPCPTVST